jgi:hypothetical protein
MESTPILLHEVIILMNQEGGASVESLDDLNSTINGKCHFAQ